MKVLVTGGSGFIGSHVADRLVDNGYEVVVIDVRDYDWDNKDRIRFIECDVCDNEKLNDIFEEEGFELVVHMAANTMLRKSIEDPMYDARLNILGTISVLECMRKNNVDKLVYTSTGGARVGDPEYLPVDEKHPINPTSPYGISKHTAEHYVWLYGELYGIDYLIFCFGNVYGPRDSPLTKRLVPIFLDKFLKNEVPMIFGDGSKTRDFIYVKDLVDFIIKSIDKIGETENKLFHLANGKEVSVSEMVRIMKEVSGSDIEPEHVDDIKGEVQDIVLDISLAKDELGWNPITHIRDGIRETWDWVRDHRK
ncbi:UDP-glucose 4-epimerase [Candidatus Pacearchaeota archaeon]|nr:UDP-glucose 4-epimerase [Candidatus Pacearchaeota archaeon]|tara:strand:- start:1053 stop:1979 length:927 start_codon:yes stop_codon:yes gene_type:complete